MRPVACLALLTLAGCLPVTAATPPAHDPKPPAAMPAVVVDEFQFLVGDAVADTDPPRVPLLEGTPYGWGLHLRTGATSVIWREDFVLPAAPEVWGGGQDPFSAKFAPNRNLTEKRVPVPQDGWIGHTWLVAAGDPPGRYRMSVYIDGVLVHDFEFECVTAAPDP